MTIWSGVNVSNHAVALTDCTTGPQTSSKLSTLNLLDWNVSQDLMVASDFLVTTGALLHILIRNSSCMEADIEWHYSFAFVTENG